MYFSYLLRVSLSDVVRHYMFYNAVVVYTSMWLTVLILLYSISFNHSISPHSAFGGYKLNITQSKYYLHRMNTAILSFYRTEDIQTCHYLTGNLGGVRIVAV